MNATDTCMPPQPALVTSCHRKRILTCIVLCWMALPSSPAAEVRVGVAATEITPPLGVAMAGYYHARGADGVLDPLFSKAMVIESGGERAAMVTLDIISVARAITDQARARIEKADGIQGSRLMISATHAHTGPELANENIGYIPDRRSYAEGNYEPESARCAAGSGEKLVEAAIRLLRELKP